MTRPVLTRTLLCRWVASVSIAAALSPSALAKATADEELFRVFSACDRTFFEKLTEERAQWSERMALSMTNGVAHPTVEDRRYERINWQTLRQPLSVAGVSLIAYHDAKNEVPSADGVGKQAFWGFLVEGAPASIVAKIRPFVRDEERFKPAVGVDWPAWIRGEMRLAKDPVDQWTKIDVPLGEVPKPATVERVLIVEPAETGPGMKLVNGMSVIECSLQGDVSPALLHRVRPDMDDAVIANW